MNPLDFIPEKYRWLAILALFAITHVDRALRRLIAIGGIRGLWNSLLNGSKKPELNQAISEHETDTQKS